jgi:hypothetical protein
MEDTEDGAVWVTAESNRQVSLPVRLPLDPAAPSHNALDRVIKVLHAEIWSDAGFSCYCHGGVEVARDEARSLVVECMWSRVADDVPAEHVAIEASQLTSIRRWED